MHMNPEFVLQSPALILLLIPSVIGLLKYGMSIWAIRTARNPAEQKAQTEVARLAVSSSPIRSVLDKAGIKMPKNDGTS